MRKSTTCLAILATAIPAMPTEARSPVLIQAVQSGFETVRYYKGKPTLDLHQRFGSVQVSPFTIDKGALVFTVAVFNRSGAPVNVGIENVSAAIDGAPYKVMTVEELIKKAQDKARWQRIGLAFLGGLAAYSASQPTTYHGIYATPYGTSSFYGSVSNPYAAYNSMVIGAQTGLAMSAVQDQLDRTTDALGDNVMQLTTIDPGSSYAGKVVLAKLRDTQLPKRVRLAVSLNGETYPFEFQVVKMGTAAPVFTAVAQPNFEPVPAAMPASSPSAPTKSKAVIQETVEPTGPGGPLRKRAKTASGWCLLVDRDYRGSGALNSPAVTDGMPRCESLN